MSTPVLLTARLITAPNKLQPMKIMRTLLHALSLANARGKLRID